MASDNYLLLFEFSLLVMLLCTFFPSLGFAAVRLSIVCVFVDVPNFLELEFCVGLSFCLGIG